MLDKRAADAARQAKRRKNRKFSQKSRRDTPRDDTRDNPRDNPRDLPRSHSAPVPVPDPDLTEGEEIQGIRLPDDKDLAAHQVEQLGTPRFGPLGGRDAPAVVNLCPIKGWEYRAATRRKIRYWGGFVTVMREIREEASKPKPPPAGEKPPDKRLPWENDDDDFAEWADRVSRGEEAI